MANVQKSTDSSSLAEVVDRILDKGIVIDVWAKVSLVGIELLVDRGPRGHRQRRDVPEVRRGDWFDRQCRCSRLRKPGPDPGWGGGCPPPGEGVKALVRERPQEILKGAPYG